jgi:hypothetical protein
MVTDPSETPLDRLRSALSLENKSDDLTLRTKVLKRIYKPFYAQVKIIDILPADITEPEVIRCTLRNRQPWDRSPYTALSYVWGDPQHTVSIFVNGRQVPVTVNLAGALRRLRDLPNYAKSLWVDALCIDQQNEREKSQQVQMMDVIFRKAETVVAWLGPADDTSERAMWTLKELSKIAKELGIQDVHRPDESQMKQEQCKVIVTAARQAALQSAAFQRGDWGCVVDLLRRPYWKRLWVLQEVSLGKRAILTCGPDTITWEKSQAALAMMCWVFWRAIDAKPVSDEASAHFARYMSPYLARDWDVPPAVWLSARALMAGESGLEYAQLFSYTCDYTTLEASEPSDCIYAIRGLMTPSLRKAITVDYERGPIKLFTAVTLYSLECYGADVLIYCGLAYRCASQMPSWALDRTSNRPRGENITHGMRNYKRSVPRQIRLSAPGKIVMRGAKLGRIVAVKQYSGRAEDTAELMNEVEQLYRTTFGSSSSLRPLILSVLLYRAGVHDTVPLDENELWNTSPRSLLITEHGHVGSGPSITQIDDVVHAFEGCGLTFLLRPSSDPLLQEWHLVGPSYVEGVTSLGDGDEMQAFWDSGPDVKDIVLY